MAKIHKAGTFSFLCCVSGTGKWRILALTLLQVILGISSVCYALLLKNIINAAVAGERKAFFVAVGCFAGLTGLQILLKAWTRWLDEKTRSDLENRFKSRLLSVLLKKPYASVSQVHSGEWMNRLTSDTTVVANGLAGILPGAAGMLVKLVGAVSLILLLEPRFGCLILPCGILLVVFSYAFRKKSKVLHKNVQQADGRLRIFLQDILGSMLVVRSYARESAAAGEATEKMQAHQNARMQKIRFSNLCNIGFACVMSGAYVLGAAFCGYGILVGSMSYGTFMAVLQLIGQVQNPFANISGYLPQWYAMLASAERLREAEQFPEQPEEPPMPLAEILAAYAAKDFCIGMEHAQFSYAVRSADSGEEAGQVTVLQDFHFVMHKGEFVALTGHSGCGKSTMMKLLLSLYALEQGEAYVVCHGMREKLQSKWQNLFAYVPQGNYLMSGTIREIVSFSHTAESTLDNRIYHALEVAGAAVFVRQLENGLDTLLGERGAGLSEGQMQRIAIARAIFSEHPILLLDESTSALDLQTEKQVLQNIRQMTEKTVLIVTHRPAALEICDTVISMSPEEKEAL